MNDSTKIRKEEDGFDKKVLAIIPFVQGYVKHRLYTAETSGIIPRNMYKTNGIIDDAIVKLYEKYKNKIDAIDDLKLKLFGLVSDNLDELYKKEEFHKNTVSTSKMLERELTLLKENYAMDLDTDLLLPEELDDISYHQNHREGPSVLYADAEKNIISVLDIYDSRKELNEENRVALNKIYNWLPFETSNILDLFVFGKLNYDEIAEIKDIDRVEVKNIISAVSKNFRKNLN
jgi:DNA-directed RNA polymerase specialized sigma24 family protein